MIRLAPRSSDAWKGPLGIFSRIPPVDLVVLALLLAALVYMSLTAPVHRWGDGSTYYMQALSITYDHDIEYTAQDLQRLAEHPLDDAPAGMYLIKTPDGRYFYGKDFSYALFASPLFAIFGGSGLLLFNALMLFGMVAMGYLYLRSENGIYSTGIALLFFALSAMFAYAFWAEPDLYDAFLIMLGIFLWALYQKNLDSKYLAMASLALGLAVVAKAPNAVVFLPLVLYEAYKKRFKNLLVALGAFAVPVILFYGYFYLQSGALSFYGGDRYYYQKSYPFAGDFNATVEAGVPAFSATDRQGLMINLHDVAIIPYNLAYYFAGRFTGMLWYYPLAALALVSFLWCIRDKEYFKRNAWKLPILEGIAFYVLFHIVLIGGNYSGGGWMIGNRYFYIYPAFLFLLGRVDWKKALPFVLLALVTVVPIAADPIGHLSAPAAHTYEFPYPYFPLEYSQIDNLMLPGTTVADNGKTLTIYGGSPAYSNGYLIIDKPADLLVKSAAPVDSFKVALLSPDATGARVSMGNISEDVRVSDTQYNVVAFQNIRPAYRHDRYYLYELQARFYNRSDSQ